MCGHVGTAGQGSGCDSRAVCLNEPLGGVTCKYKCIVHAHTCQIRTCGVAWQELSKKACCYISLPTGLGQQRPHDANVHAMKYHARLCTCKCVCMPRCDLPLFMKPGTQDGSQCEMPDYRKICTKASVSLGNQLLKGPSGPHKSTGFIRESELKLMVSHPQIEPHEMPYYDEMLSSLKAGEYTVRSLPLAGKLEEKVTIHDTATLTIQDTGKVQLELMQGDLSLCTFLSELTIECDSGLSAHGSRCKSTDMSSVTIGVGMGVLTTLCMALLLVYIYRNPGKAKQILKSFMRKLFTSLIRQPVGSACIPLVRCVMRELILIGPLSD